MQSDFDDATATDSEESESDSVNACSNGSNSSSDGNGKEVVNGNDTKLDLRKKSKFLNGLFVYFDENPLIDDIYTCPCCLDVVCDPVTCGNVYDCSSLFCRTCLQDFHDGVCPGMCKMDVIIKPAIKSVRDKLFGYRVLCIHNTLPSPNSSGLKRERESGCSWVGQLSNLQKHLSKNVKTRQ